MTTREYDITGSGLDHAATLAKARKLADRAQKKGMTGGYTLSIDTRFVGADPEDEDGYACGEERHFLIVSGTPAAIAGYRFVALVTWNNGLPVVTTHPDYDGESVDRSVLVQGACDHCGVKRNRNHQIVVEQVESGERKVVGSACCKDFLGQVLNPSFFTDPFEAEFGNLGGRGEVCFRAETILTDASRVIRLHGFVSRAQAEERFTTATSSLVTLLYGQGNAANEMRRTTPAADADDAANTSAVLAWVESEPALTDWSQNLQAVLSADADGNRWVPMRHIGLVVSAMGVWLRKQADAARTSIPVIEEFVGTAGDKVEFTEATVVAERNIESDWGYSTIYTIVADDHRFDWITSGSTVLTVGEKGALKGTVKKHREWESRDGQARKTTVLTRCKFAAAV